MKKIRYSNLFILGIFVYIIFYSISSIVGKNIHTKVLESEMTDMKISRKCLIIRDEYLLKSDTNGEVNLLVDEGERVTKLQEVANVYSNVDRNIDASISSLDEEIEKLKNGEINLSKKEISKFNEKIERLYDEIQIDLLVSDYSNIKEDKEILENYLSDKNKLLNNGIDSIKLASKEEQKKILEKQRLNNVFSYYSSMSGIISFKFDGKEEKYNFSNLHKISKSDIEKENNKYEDVSSKLKKVKDGSVLLRIINNYDAYIVTYVSEDESKNFKKNQSIKLDSSDNEIEATVYDVYEDNDNFIAIFKINNQNMGIYDTRVKEFDIIYKQVEGLKIPKSSIKTVNNKEGVYIINEENKTPVFVELKGIEYEDDNFKYINHYKNNISGVDTVDLYDKIILKPNIINTKMKIE